MRITLGHPGGFDAIIDARSEDEYALDHLPNAVNWPSLNNEERIIIGTMYKQLGGFEAQAWGSLGGRQYFKTYTNPCIGFTQKLAALDLLLARWQAQWLFSNGFGPNWIQDKSD